VRALMASARALGYASINADLIYGLPKQTPQSFARTIRQIGELRPDRIALYAYAHLPERFKPQRRIVEADLPAPAQRLAMLGDGIAGFLARGYTYIGMDHFALPDDALAVAKREGRLHRNFQGYSTQPDCDLVALGVSAIGSVGSAYYQNAKTLPEYYESLARGRLPVVRGYALDIDDELRRDVVMALMCQGRLEFAPIARRHHIDVRSYFERELASLQGMAESGLVELEDGAVQVTAAGWFLVRAIAMVFDRHLHAAKERHRFSKVL
jgi:oxygen-independent coproporphyrinogen-3 oxidase